VFRFAQEVRRSAIAAGAAVFALSFTPATRADVIDVHADGSTTTLTGPVISTSDGASPVQAIARSPRPARRTEPRPDVSNTMKTAGQRFQISDRLIEAVAWQESHFNQNARSPKGATGIMQLMPSTAQDLGVNAGVLSGNVDGGAAYLSTLLRRYDDNLVLALSAYNAGPAVVAKYRGEPPFVETRDFVDGVLGQLATMSENSNPGLEIVP
jgi:soluble lytic murein transglycosylase-like protein